MAKTKTASQLRPVSHRQSLPVGFFGLPSQLQAAISQHMVLIVCCLPHDVVDVVGLNLALLIVLWQVVWLKVGDIVEKLPWVILGAGNLQLAPVLCQVDIPVVLHNGLRILSLSNP